MVTSPGWLEWLPAVSAAMALPGVFYWIITTALIARRARAESAEAPPTADLPPVTFLRPVKKGVPELGDKARRLLLSARPGDRVLFGVDSPEDLSVCEAACADAPQGVSTGVLFCAPPDAPSSSASSGLRNPKIEKLLVLCAADEQWGPPHWIITDSEALPDRRFMDVFRAEWAAHACAAGPSTVLTAGYRFTGAANAPQCFDHLASLLTLWPGLAAAEWGTRKGPGGLGFTLGACIAVRREDVARVGGWEAFATVLAEDNRLGVALAEEGAAIRLSRQILTLDSDPIGWRAWGFHQHRVAFTYRICNPAGAFAMVFTHGVSWSFLSVLLAPMSPFGWAFFAAVCALRITTARRNARRLRFLDDTPLARFGWSVLATSLAETVFWLIAWLPLPVRWGERFLRVDARGRLRGSSKGRMKGVCASPARGDSVSAGQSRLRTPR